MLLYLNFFLCRLEYVSSVSFYLVAARPAEKDLGFMRIGSFNSRVKRTAAALTNPFGVQKLKPWGSADSVTDVVRPCFCSSIAFIVSSTLVWLCSVSLQVAFFQL